MTDVFITVRTGSSRLPRKCLLPLGDCNVLEHVIRRAKWFGFAPVVCTTVHESDDVVEAIADQEDVRVFRGTINNVMERWIGCARWFNLDQFHALDCDDPYFCGDEIKRSMEYMKSKEAWHIEPTKSSTDLALGMMGHSFDLRQNRGSVFVLPESEHQYRKWRLTLDYQEDYWLLATIARYHGWKPSRWIIDETSSVPISVINQFRNKEWKENQWRETHSANTMETNSITLQSS